MAQKTGSEPGLLFSHSLVRLLFSFFSFLFLFFFTSSKKKRKDYGVFTDRKKNMILLRANPPKKINPMDRRNWRHFLAVGRTHCRIESSPDTKNAQPALQIWRCSVYKSLENRKAKRATLLLLALPKVPSVMRRFSSSESLYCGLYG